MIFAAALLTAAAFPSDDDCCRRPCVSYLAVGQFTWGKRQPAQTLRGDDSVTLLGGMQSYRFTQQRIVLGKRPRVFPILRQGIDIRPFGTITALIALSTDEAGRYRLAGWAPVWKDARGRAFVPVWTWPQGRGYSSRWQDWRPDNFRQFAKPVDYRGKQPLARAFPWSIDPDLNAGTEARPRFRLGVYVDDMPAMFAKAGACSAS